MERIFRILLMVLIAGTAFTSCYYDNEEELYPAAGECDTTNVTFTADVLPTVDQICQSCHSGNTPSGNLSLETFDQISAAAEKMYSRISLPPGDPKLMPPGQKLDECTIKKIKAWIDNGKPNN